MATEQSTVKHTPTPWTVLPSVSNDSLVDADGGYVAHISPRVDPDEERPLAAHIVKCVNAWDDTTALRARLDELNAVVRARITKAALAKVQS